MARWNMFLIDHSRYVENFIRMSGLCLYFRRACRIAISASCWRSSSPNIGLKDRYFLAILMILGL